MIYIAILVMRIGTSAALSSPGTPPTPPPAATAPSAPPPVPSFAVDLMYTREVRGATYPVNERNTQCSAATLENLPCNCFGGAARRSGVLASAGPDAVKLDLGGFSSGSGLFFPALRGEASSEFLADANYSAIGLTYRDFAAGINSSNPTGGAWLASHISRARALNPKLPPAVVTNIDLTGDEHLVQTSVTRDQPNPPGHIAPFALVPLAGNRTLAFLALLDPQHLHPTTPHYANKVFAYDRALQSALARLRRLEGGAPDVIVVAINDLPTNGAPNGFPNLLARHHTSNSGEAKASELRTLVNEAIGVDVFLLGTVSGLDLPTVLTNWAGDEVWMAQGRSTHGKDVDHITARFDTTHGRLLGSTVVAESIPLDCHSPVDRSSEAKLNWYHDRMEHVLGETRGYLQTALDFPTSVALASTIKSHHEHGWGSCVRIGTERDTEVCGCRVSECPQGSFAADALQLAANADIGLVNGGSIRSSISSGPVTEARIVEMLPFLNGIVKLEVAGSIVRAALLNSISRLGDASAPTSPNGRFMHVSSSLKFEWYFEDDAPVLGAVSFSSGVGEPFTPLSDTQVYTVAMTSYLAGGGDGYSMFRGLPSMPLKTQNELTAQYLSSTAPSLPGLPMPSAGRIVQTPAIVRLDLGILCNVLGENATGGGIVGREECDRIHHAIDIINDKSDGLYDDVLPNAVIVAHEQPSGCNAGLALGAFRRLRAASTTMNAVIGPACSDDVKDLAHASVEETHGVAFISGSSTLTALADEAVYPRLARTVTADSQTAKAFQALNDLYSWRRVAVLHTDSQWARSVSYTFARGLQDADKNAQIIGAGPMEFSDSADLDVAGLLKSLEDVDARIIFLAAEPQTARRLFKEVYRSGRLYGEGFAWLLAGISEDMFLNQDGTVDLEALYGAEGVLAFRERADASTDMYHRYVNHWRGRASADVCHGRASMASYCDADGDHSTLGGYSPFYADAVLLYAHAMHSIFRSSSIDAAALYASIKSLAPIDGISGSLALDPASADRLGSLSLLNLQLAQVGGGPRAHVDRRRLITSYAELVSVGTYHTGAVNGSSAGLTLNPDVSIIWPGGLHTPPSDTPVKRNTALIAALISVPCVVLVVSLAMLLWQKLRSWKRLKKEKEEVERQKAQAEKHRLEAGMAKMAEQMATAEAAQAKMAEQMATAEAAQAKRELRRFQDAMVGVRAVVSAFQPSPWLARHRNTGSSNGDNGAAAKDEGSSRGDSESKPTGGAIPTRKVRRRLPAYYWNEDADRISAHNASDVLARDGLHYVRYAWNVCELLEDGYEDFMQAKGRIEPLLVDLTNQIPSTGTEEKAFAKDSGVRFTIDFKAMEQTNVKTGFRRRVIRVEPPMKRMEDPPEGLPPNASPFAASLKVSLGAAMGAAAAMIKMKDSEANGGKDAKAGLDLVIVDPSTPPPQELAGEDFLVVEPGQLIQTSATRPDGWARGQVVLDPVENRQASGIDGVSVTSGWFPMSHTALPNADQLEKLQRKMGDGASDALRPPSSWSRVADPMVAELVSLPDGTEKTQAIDAFTATLGGYSNLKVVEVQRIQNEAMWQSYAVKRQTILQREKNQASAARLERKWLFHGTDEQTVPKIIQQGFNRSFCGKNATAYGKGVYFARDAAYSASSTYARPNGAGVQHMFLCRVVVGEFCQGRRNALAPDVRTGNMLYDSTVDSVSNPRMYITYHDAQAYPEYLVKFKQ